MSSTHSYRPMQYLHSNRFRALAMATSAVGAVIQPIAPVHAQTQSREVGAVAEAGGAAKSVALDVGAPGDAQSKPEQFEEITVTARRPMIDYKNATFGAFGAKDVMEIPLSIQSFSNVLLENQRARTLLDVMQNDPSVQNGAPNGNYSNLRIRGFSTDWTNTIRRNGLSLAPYQDVPLEGVDQVSLLKGPSGFLYGFNSPGGTVNYITKGPTKEPFAELTAEGRSYDGWYLHLDTSQKISDRAGFRVNVGHEEVGDYTHNGDLKRSFATAGVDWEISDAVLVKLDADYQEKGVAAQPLIGVSTGKLPPLYNPRTLLGQPWLQYRTKAFNVGSRLDYTVSDSWTISAQAAYSQLLRDAASPSIAGALDNGDIIVNSTTRARVSPGQSYKTVSGQLFITGKFRTIGVDHEMVLGASGVSYRGREAGTTNISTNIRNIFNPVYMDEPSLIPNLPKTHNDVVQASPFVSDLIKLSDSWQALVGARYINFKNTVTAPGANPVIYKRNKIVPNIGLIYRPQASIMFYADYTKGVEQSGVAPSIATNAGVTLAPLDSEQYEAGAKVSLNDHINLGLALFEITKTLEFVDSNLLFQQGGRQRHKGVEFTFSGRLTKGLMLNGGASYLSTNQINTGDLSVNGQRTPNTPKWQVNLAVDYQLPFAPRLYLNGAVQYVGSRPVNAANSVFVPSYTVADVGARYVSTILDRPVVWRVYVRNITDERYWASAETSGVLVGAPRTVYVSTQINF